MPYDAEMLAHLQGLYAEPRYAWRGEPVAEWRASARPALRELLGLTRMAAELAQFSPVVTLGEIVDHGDWTRQPGVLQAEPHFSVPFWYLKPKGPGPFPLGVFPHGHYQENGLDYAAGVAASPAMADAIAAEDRDVAVQAVRRGFAAIAPATRGFPPAGIADITHRHGDAGCRSHAMHVLLAGRTVIGERVWDLERLIDWASSRDDIDGQRVLMMGNSGGGVATTYAAACDERVTVAVASCSFCTYVGTSGAIHHCDCNVVPGILRFGEFHDVAGLIAPRRQLVVHGRTDRLFPLAEIERAVDGVRTIYAAARAAEAFGHAWGPGGHRFYADLMWPFVTAALA